MGDELSRAKLDVKLANERHEENWRAYVEGICDPDGGADRLDAFFKSLVDYNAAYFRLREMERGETESGDSQLKLLN